MHNFKSLLFIVVSLFAIWWFGRPIMEVVLRVDRIESLQQEVQALNEERNTLTAKVEYYRTTDFVEVEARNRLNYSREGEVVVIVPEETRELLENSRSTESLPQLPPWRQWFQLFFE